MKKILVGLLVLAFAGGGVFAQGWTFNGMATGGFGMFFLEDDDEDVRVAPITDNTTAAGRVQLDARFTNADQTAGLTFRVRGDGNTADAAAMQNNTALGAFFDWGFGWLSFADNMVRVYGGRVENGFFSPLDRMFHQDVGGGMGVLTILRPMDGLALGFGGFSAGAGNMTLDGEGTTDQPLFSFQVRYDDPTFRITAGARTRSSVGTNGFGHSRLAGGLAPGLGGAAAPSAAYASFAWLGTPDLHAAFTARFMNLEEFGDYGDMRFYATFGHTGLVEGLDLRLGASFGMTMEEEIGTNDDPAPHIWVWFSAAYAVTERVIPSLNVHYVMGGQWNNFQRIHHWGARDGATFHEDDSFIHIRPAVRFAISGSSYVEVGGIFNIDLGDEDTRPASWGGGNASHGTNIGAFALMTVSF